MPPKRVASEAAKATQGRACFEFVVAARFGFMWQGLPACGVPWRPSSGLGRDGLAFYATFDPSPLLPFSVIDLALTLTADKIFTI
jgi:hypothetical protein